MSILVAMSTPRWVVSYDVSSDRRRRQLSTILASQGFRALYSVFEIETETSDMSRLMIGVRTVVDHGDLFLAVPTCANCWRWERGAPIEYSLGTGVVI